MKKKSGFCWKDVYSNQICRIELLVQVRIISLVELHVFIGVILSFNDYRKQLFLANLCRSIVLLGTSWRIICFWIGNNSFSSYKIHYTILMIEELP